MESGAGSSDGLGLLPGYTVLATEKISRRIGATTPSGIPFDAYEIHLGVTTRPQDAESFATLDDGTLDGIRTGQLAGTYLHGALENERVLSELLGRTIDPQPAREANYEAMADWFEANVNQKLFEDLYLC